MKMCATEKRAKQTSAKVDVDASVDGGAVDGLFDTSAVGQDVVDVLFSCFGDVLIFKAQLSLKANNRLNLALEIAVNVWQRFYVGA